MAAEEQERWYYTTQGQGGGIAVMDHCDNLVWQKPPEWFTKAQVGDVVPEEWDIIGPFDRETHELSGD
jgi:hypothetical protein